MGIRVIAVKDYQEMSRKTASVIAAQILMKPDCVLGLATGSTPIGAYERLIEMHDCGDLDFSRVRSFNLDEYAGLPRTNDQSYYYFMHHQLFDRIGFTDKQSNFLNGMEEDAEKECRAYDEKILAAGGIDLQLLGLGHDGHIGFNEPADSFECGTHPVVLKEETIRANSRFFSSVDEVPKMAYTMGIGSIMQARKIVMAVSGTDKAAILSAALTGPVMPSVPASILQFHPDAIVIADEAALSECRL